MRQCHWCKGLLFHAGMFCCEDCSRAFWVAQADASPLRTERSRRTQAAIAQKKQRQEKKAG